MAPAIAAPIGPRYESIHEAPQESRKILKNPTSIQQRRI